MARNVGKPRRIWKIARASYWYTATPRGEISEGLLKRQRLKESVKNLDNTSESQKDVAETWRNLQGAARNIPKNPSVEWPRVPALARRMSFEGLRARFGAHLPPFLFLFSPFSTFSLFSFSPLLFSLVLKGANEGCEGHPPSFFFFLSLSLSLSLFLLLFLFSSKHVYTCSPPP